MREFLDATGSAWVATVRERSGPDYKGRFHLVFEVLGGGEVVEVKDVRWNSEATARRTVETMSEVELRRRLRQASGRGAGTA